MLKHGILQVNYKGYEQMVRISDIEYIEADRWRCKICTADKVIICAKRMNRLCGMLAEYGFVRCHKGFAVNIGRVSCFRSKEIILLSGRTVPIGRAYKNSLPGNRKE